MSGQRFDLIVLGAGSAGAAAAAFAAEAGLRVALLEKGSAETAGARWVNAVAAAQFSEAGVAPSTGAEHRGEDHRFHLIAGWGKAQVSAHPRGILEVDMRHLIARLQARAQQAGAVLRDGVTVRGLGDQRLQTSAGPFTADFYVDASGLAGANLLATPPPAPGDVCVAAQEVFALGDRSAATRFFAEHGASLGEVLCFTAVSGGYSIVNVRVLGDEVSVLAGSTPVGGTQSGQRLLRSFVAAQPWIGERSFGGARTIPLRRPGAVLARGRIAAIGDAAGQVYSPHGSGVGLGLIAARRVVDAIITDQSTLSYARAWRRSHGAGLAAQDVFRRFSASLDADSLAMLIRSGVLDAETLCAGLEQRLPRLSAAALARKARALTTLGPLARPLFATLTEMGWVRASDAAAAWASAAASRAKKLRPG